MKQLQGHIGQKPECRSFMAELRCQLKMTLMQPPPHGLAKSVPFLSNPLLLHNSTLQPNKTAASAEASDTPNDNDEVIFPLNDDDDYSPNDFEAHNFKTLSNTNQEDVLLDAKPAVYTHSRRMEVTLLKILTNMKYRG